MNVVVIVVVCISLDIPNAKLNECHFYAMTNNKTSTLCFRHERIHTKKNNGLKGAKEAAHDTVDDLATMEVLDEVRDGG